MLNDFERSVLEHSASADQEISASNEISESDWLRFGLLFLIEVSRIIRKVRLGTTSDVVSYKADGSPLLPIEREIEDLLQRRLARFAPDTVVVGEDCGGTLEHGRNSIAIDPIDGTWAFINRAETHTATLAFFRGMNPFLGMLVNPTTGELAYATSNGSTRLIQLPMQSGGAEAIDLPIERNDPNLLMVNVHPAKSAGPLMEMLFRRWLAGEVQSLKATAGSPAWSLLETAKGGFCYVNLWPGKAADPFDLTPGVMLVRSAGGDVVDLRGKPISCSDHSGPFVAALSRKNMQRLVQIVAEAPASAVAT